MGYGTAITIKKKLKDLGAPATWTKADRHMVFDLAFHVHDSKYDDIQIMAQNHFTKYITYLMIRSQRKENKTTLPSGFQKMFTELVTDQKNVIDTQDRLAEDLVVIEKEDIKDEYIRDKDIKDEYIKN